MLVLTRKPGERIVIGDDIFVTLVAVRRDDEYGDKIRIGVEAPPDVPIRREEVPDPRKVEQPGSAEADLSYLEVEIRRVGQKVHALAHQTAREFERTDADAQRVGQLSEALLSLRRRCDELLDQLGKATPSHGKS